MNKTMIWSPLNLLISNQYLFKSLKTYNAETKRLNLNEKDLCVLNV